MEVPDVRPGQVWADNDKRCAGRHVRVENVGPMYAHVIAVDPQGRPSPNSDQARRTRILLTRFRPTATGYRIVSDITDQQGMDSRG